MLYQKYFSEGNLQIWKYASENSCRKSSKTVENEDDNSKAVNGEGGGGENFGGWAWERE